MSNTGSFPDLRHPDTLLDAGRRRTVRLRCFPQVVIDREEFRRRCKAAAGIGRTPKIYHAVDGLVKGPSYIEIDAEGNVFINTNHHTFEEDPNTPSTCMQISQRMNVTRAELYQWADLVDGATPEDLHAAEPQEEEVHANDADPDVTTSFWLRLKATFVERLKFSNDPENRRRLDRITALVIQEDRIDMHAGLCRLDPHDQLVQEMVWIFDPYMKRRANGLLTMSAAEMEELVIEMSSRIDQYVEGMSGRMDLDLRCTQVAGVRCPDDVAIIEEAESGPHARIAMVNADKRLIINVRRKPGDLYVYTIVKVLPQVTPFAITPCDYVLRDIFNRLNAGIPHPNGEEWDGRTNAGGGPRDGTTQTPQDVVNAVAQCRILKPATDPPKFSPAADPSSASAG